MGLSSSPRIFTKLNKLVLAELCQKEHINIGYIDDFWFLLYVSARVRARVRLT